ncbi:MAG: hypothetical protein LBJ67_08690 [Planctomycetaceae bacterium]|jgi:uncharacterized membrane protein|nr:hypothetical protein [Planctomycetaceae bacterium]
MLNNLNNELTEQEQIAAGQVPLGGYYSASILNWILVIVISVIVLLLLCRLVAAIPKQYNPIPSTNSTTDKPQTGIDEYLNLQK